MSSISGLIPIRPQDQISALLSNLRKVYRQQNSYHNFAHALDVLQATHSFLHSAGRVPPVSILLRRNRRTWKPDRGRLEKSLVSCLRNQDLLCLYIASIGHDVGHPGFTNGFMVTNHSSSTLLAPSHSFLVLQKNAKAPLSSLYDDKSPLEQMHFTLLLHLMRHQGLDALLDNPRSGAQFRKLLLEIVLATDMRVHLEFMIRFKRLVDGEVVDEWKKKLLVCQALIKCADISNPVSVPLIALAPSPACRLACLRARVAASRFLSFAVFSSAFSCDSFSFGFGFGVGLARRDGFSVVRSASRSTGRPRSWKSGHARRCWSNTSSFHRLSARPTTHSQRPSRRCSSSRPLRSRCSS